MTYSNPFSRRVVMIVSIIGVVSLLAAVYFTVRGGRDQGPARADADSSSRSAVGHRAFYDLLGRLGISTTRSRGRTLDKVRRRGVLVLLEPDLDRDRLDLERERGREDLSPVIRELLDADKTTLLVLPKWRQVEDRRRPGWSESVELLGEGVVQRVLDAAGVDGQLRRHAQPLEGWDIADELAHAGADPDLPLPQLLTTDDLIPLITRGGDVLLGEFVGASADRQRQLLLTDPDLLSNHGIVRGDNAILAYEIIELLRKPFEHVVFDETIHGARMTEGPFAALFRFPLVLLTLHAMIAGAVFLAAAMGRFGNPRRPPSPIDRSPGFRIRNTAALLRLGGHDGSGLERYYRDTMQSLGQALHYRGSSNLNELVDYIGRIAKVRGMQTSPRQLFERVKEARQGNTERERVMLSVAREIHRFKKEMVHGAGTRT